MFLYHFVGCKIVMKNTLFNIFSIVLPIRKKIIINYAKQKTYGFNFF